MPACAARYDVTLNDGICTGYSHGIPKRGGDLERAILDYAEDRVPDDFGDPGPLVSARFVAGETWDGRPVSECRPGRIGHRGSALFRVDGSGHPKWVASHHRRSLSWAWREPDPAPDDDPEWVCPP